MRGSRLKPHSEDEHATRKKIPLLISIGDAHSGHGMLTSANALELSLRALIGEVPLHSGLVSQIQMPASSNGIIFPAQIGQDGESEKSSASGALVLGWPPISSSRRS